MSADILRLDRAICSSLDDALQREWLETNGLGGYASSTVAGHRGAIGFVLESTLGRDAATAPDDTAKITDLNARAEAIARQGAADWTAWLTQQLQTTNA